MNNNIKFKEVHTGFFKNKKRIEELDDLKFNIWKTELLKDLPSFWESISEGS